MVKKNRYVSRSILFCIWMKRYSIIIFYDPNNLFLCQNAIKPVEMPLHGQKAVQNFNFAKSSNLCSFSEPCVFIMLLV